MSNVNTSFSNILERIYNLPLEDREELKMLLENNISDSKRDEILTNAKKAKTEEANKKLKFSSSIKELKKMLN